MIIMLYPYRNTVGSRYGRMLRLGMRSLRRYIPRRLPTPSTAVGTAVVAEAIRRALGSNKRVIPFAYSGRGYKKMRMLRQVGLGGCRARARSVKYFRKGFPKYNAGFQVARKSDLKKVDVWHVDRKIAMGRIVSNINECKYDYKLVGTPGDIDDYCQLKQKNAAGADETIDLRTLNNAKMVVRGIGEVEIKNNTGLDIHITYYLFRYKLNVSSTPFALLESGLDDYTDGNVTNPETNVLFYAEHSTAFNRDVYTYKKRKVCLEPGKELRIRYQTPYILYDPQVNDRIGTSYVAGLSTGVLIRVQGQVAHDQATVGNVGYSSATLDVVEKKMYRYGFVSKAEIKKVTITEAFGTPPTQCVGANEEGQEAVDDAV